MLTYLPLPSSTSTRLFTLAPGQGHEPISGSLITIDIAQQHIHYEAVSYTWGTDTITVQISVDQQQHRIRLNLYQCLTRLRLPTVPRALWIDYLSISQTDLDEKAQQVQHIGEFFSGADRVLVWLGEHANKSEELFRPWPTIPQEPPRGIRRLFWMTALEIPRQEALRRAGIWAAFFSRRYWTRTWIVQEVGLAKSILVHCGHDSMDWTELISSRMRPDKFYFDGLSLTRNGDKDAIWDLTTVWVQIKALDRLWLKMEEGPKGDESDQKNNRSIFDFIERFKGTRCYDPRDQVYALLSLEERRCGGEDIHVDYRARLPDIVLMLYERRYVETLRPLKPLPGSKHIPSPHMLIEALRLSRVQCQQIIATIDEKIRVEHRKPQKKRWEEVLWLFKDEASDFDSYFKDRLRWWSNPDPEALEYDEADSDSGDGLST